MKKRVFVIFISVFTLFFLMSFVSCKKQAKESDNNIVESTQVSETNKVESVPSFQYEFSGFKYKSYNIKDIEPKIKQVETDLSEKLKKLSSKDTVFIYGYADKKGPEAQTGKKMGNLILSRKRAQAVADYLVEKYGIPSSLFSVEGKGSSNLKDSSNPYSGKNRRVVISYK